MDRVFEIVPERFLDGFQEPGPFWPSAIPTKATEIVDNHRIYFVLIASQNRQFLAGRLREFSVSRLASGKMPIEKYQGSRYVGAFEHRWEQF